MKPRITPRHTVHAPGRSIGSSRRIFRATAPAGPLLLLLFALAAAALHAGGSSDQSPEAEAPGSADAEGVPPGAYTPLVSPLPGRVGKPIEEWGIDNGETVISHTFSSFSNPMYPPDFPHFDYVNPDAPQGGTLRLAAQGTYDSFHMYGRRGDWHPFMGSFYDTLMTSSTDEIDALYPLIAERIEYAKDFSYVIFHIDPRARFQDGEPVTAEDAVFSFNKFFNEGVPQFANSFSTVKSVEAVERLKVRFDLEEPSRERIAALTALRILPRQFWQDRDFSEPLQEVPLGSGAWTVADYRMGSFILFEQIDDYWAADLPVSRGIGNFKYYRLDFYKDESVMLEAFKAGDYDYRDENIAKNWAAQYEGPLFENGALIKAPFADPSPPVIYGMVFNTSRDLFRDYRVRRALSYAMDFEWMNENLFYGQYTRNRSCFQNTDYEARGLPSPEELAILEPIRDQLPPEVFTDAYQPPVSDGSGSIRGEIRKALELLEEAGWSLEDGVLRSDETGEPFEFEFIIRSPSSERVVLPFQENLKKMGITMSIALIDSTQYIERLRDGEFDMLSTASSPFLYPSEGMRIRWRSDFIDSTWNTPRVTDPAIDYLIDGIIENQRDKEALIHWGRAFDRVVQWRHYYIFNWGLPLFRTAHVDKFGKPDVWPRYGSGAQAWAYWWLDEEKLEALPENLR